jgi:hypothetical protein
VASTLCQVWHELAALTPGTFYAGVQEPHLTELLCEQIRAVFKERTKLTGQWSYERKMGRIGQSARGAIISERRRTDIEYFSDRYDPALQLVFEFKKLSHTKSRRDLYTGEKGMLRFISGDYSAGQPVAVMVGILLNAEKDCVPPLIDLLQTSKAQTALQIAATTGGPVKTPSVIFPQTARFDTEHTREATLAPPHGTIVISHVFLGFPAPVAAKLA